MYPSLFKLKLKNYIENACGGCLQEEKFFRNLDTFVGSLSEDNIKILSRKFNINAPSSEISDLLHEVEVACAFHPTANFNGGSGPDLFENGVGIEVKSINEGKEEAERHGKDEFLCISPLLSDEEKSKERELTVCAIKKKVTHHLQKASSQLKDSGLIYLIWDYNLFLHDSNGRPHMVGAINEGEMKEIIASSIADFSNLHGGLKIESYYFLEIRQRVQDKT